MCTSIEQETGEIQSIAIEQAFRRRGVASRLIGYTLKEMQASGITIVELQVRTTNTGGIRFWQNAGFSPAASGATFYDDGSEALQMQKSLT